MLTGERENGGRSFLSRMDRYTTFGVVGIWDSWLNRQVTCVNSSGVLTEMAVAYPLFTENSVYTEITGDEVGSFPFSL